MSLSPRRANARAQQRPFCIWVGGCVVQDTIRLLPNPIDTLRKEQKHPIQSNPIRSNPIQFTCGPRPGNQRALAVDDRGRGGAHCDGGAWRYGLQGAAACEGGNRGDGDDDDEEEEEQEQQPVPLRLQLLAGGHEGGTRHGRRARLKQQRVSVTA